MLPINEDYNKYGVLEEHSFVWVLQYIVHYRKSLCGCPLHAQIYELYLITACSSLYIVNNTKSKIYLSYTNINM